VSEQEKIDVVLPDHVVVHLRSVMVFAELASKYDSDIRVSAGGKDVNGKDVMDLLTLMGAGHRRMCIAARGRDALEALQALNQLVADGFGEKT